MLPIVETRPGKTVPLSDMPSDPLADMPPDPAEDRAHVLCSRCFPRPRKGDPVVGLCGVADQSFPGFSRKAKPCQACFAVVKGMVPGQCGHRAGRA